MKTIIIIGMPRTGSSLTAGICHILGVNMGKETAGYYPEWNPKGTYENLHFQRLDDQILRELGGTWDNPPLEIRIRKEAEKGRKAIERLIKKEKSDLWGWKGARTTLLLELYWLYVSYKNPHFIFCERKPEDIIASFKKTKMGDREKVLKLIKIYKDRFLRFALKHPIKYIYIQFEDWFKSPRTQTQKLIDFLEICPTKEQIQKASKFIIPREL